MQKALIEFIRDTYKSSDFIPLHAPQFTDTEQQYVADTIASTFVSSVGKYVDQFEEMIEEYTGCTKAIATVNGTAALHCALYLADVQRGDLVITQALTFVATCNALYHMGAEPVFVDISRKSLGMCPQALENWLNENAEIRDQGICVEKHSQQRIKAALPMHTFGHPIELDELKQVCQRWQITLIEDAAESLGSYYKGQHTGTLGDFAAISFNGNKIITTGGGGMLLCQSEDVGKRAKHITTTAKTPHAYEFYHDEPGFNYRLPNLNAALGCAQMEHLPRFLKHKRQLAAAYQNFFSGSGYLFVQEPDYAHSNYWLNAVICPDNQARTALLESTNAQGVMTRPVWQLMHRLPMFSNARRDSLEVSEWVESRLINLPSSPVNMELIND